MLILIVAFKIYDTYRRDYMFWFLVGILLIPLIFLYSIIEYGIEIPKGELFYPIAVIAIEIMLIIGEKRLLSSIKAEEGEEYKILLREDMMLLKTFERISNYLIARISPLIGIKNIEDSVEECIEKYPILAGMYITPDERISTYAIEKNIERIEEEERIKKLSEAFSFFIERLMDMYAAFVPYEKIAEDLRKIFSRVDPKITRWLTPFAILKIVIEPILRKCKPDELTEIRISVVIEGIKITKNASIEVHELYQYDMQEIMDKIIKFVERLHYILLRIFREEIDRELTKKFRLLPNNIKEELYKMGLIKYLPSGILEEEKLTLMSREKLIEELAERKRKLEEAYKRLAEAKLDRMKANFINIIAHELRTPLTVIKTYTDLLLHEKMGKLNKMQKEKIRSIAKNIKKLEELINDMLHIPSIQQQELELRKENFYIKDVIRNIVDELKEIAKEKKQRILVDVDDSMVNGDTNLIEKALKNVVSNSIKYTQEKGKIEIEAKKEGRNVHIKIRDNGKGIKKGELEKIFEPFYTSSEGGIGLGLAIAKSIIEGHGGEIWAESEPGKGTTFHILLRRVGK
ncbi:MAG: HAMP domain-containing histidine kinase [Thermoplasmata archaeon]|nr:HAMP domain-containing histidine kinase [Thermoplasmata archaeon]